MEKTSFRRATPSDLSLLQGLLATSDLPFEDIAPHLPHFVLAEENDRLVGVVGLEVLGSDGLLRSLVVEQTHRGQGLGHQLTEQIIDHARQQSIHTLYLLTTTAEGFFRSRGFEAIDRGTVPEAVLATQEFQHLCPSTAVCMKRTLAQP